MHVCQSASQRDETKTNTQSGDEWSIPIQKKDILRTHIDVVHIEIKKAYQLTKWFLSHH